MIYGRFLTFINLESGWELYEPQNELTMFATQDGSDNLKLINRPALEQSRGLDFWFNEWSPEWSYPDIKNDVK